MEVHFLNNRPVIATFDLTEPNDRVLFLREKIASLTSSAIDMDNKGYSRQATAIFEVVQQLDDEMEFLSNLPTVFMGASREHSANRA